MAITHLKPGSCMSEAVRVGEIIFQAGQITGDKGTGIEVQTQQVLDGIDQAMAEFVCWQSDVFWIQVWLVGAETGAFPGALGCHGCPSIDVLMKWLGW
ncbi:hypothetical protein AVO45_16910 [Ruegeria marisrubri]|uniref:Uncharacterized protein n=1 Tax=Ruegeria marisrubri TaxID=1685379 RepID=A0A0X3UAS1_9RHOB|nr:hypothetical protein [Ruegeria marisrubri]KUJ85187.1 hypothetical protein AVO45_16910 [Ruegeria marisrubri]